MSDDGKRGFVFHTSQGETELSIEEVKQLAEQNDPDGLYALGGTSSNAPRTIYLRPRLRGCFHPVAAYDLLIFQVL